MAKFLLQNLEGPVFSRRPLRQAVNVAFLDRVLQLIDQFVAGLSFDDQADLDLFVTGPDQETVYFGNNPSLGGGRLLVDVRCDNDAPRVEVVRFAAPERGRYRIGVEYARSCRFRREPAAYRIEIDAPELNRSSEGSIAPGRFVPLALEFELDTP